MIGNEKFLSMKDARFNMKLNETKIARAAFVEVCQRFLGNKNAANHWEIIEERLEAYIGNATGLLKLFFWQLNLFLKILVSYQMNMDLLHTERLYKRKWSEGMLANFCWSFRRETPSDNIESKKTT